MDQQIKTTIHDDELGKVAVITERISASKFSVIMHDVDDGYKLLNKSEKEGDAIAFHRSLREQKEHYLEESDTL